MSFRFKESRQSRGGVSLKARTETLTYTAAGTNDGTFVQTYALGATPAFINRPAGTLFRQDVKVEPMGYEMFRVSVPYGPRKRETGEYTIDFSTTGGTLHITNSLETVQKYQAAGKPDAPDMGGAIGVRGDQVDGAEVIIPALKLSVTFEHPAGIITLAHIKNLARWTGKFNTTPFMTFAPGESLFLGCSGREGTSVETSIKYDFSMSENTVQTIGAIADVEKKGWEHAWIRYEDAVDAGPPETPVKKPMWVYVERVYEGIDMAGLLGFGGA